MKDLASKAKTVPPAADSISAEEVKNKLRDAINDDICSSILEVSFQRMLKKTVPSDAEPVQTLELWSSELDAKVDFSQYRSKLVIIKFVF